MLMFASFLFIHLLLIVANPSHSSPVNFQYGTMECNERCPTSVMIALTIYGEWQNNVFTFLSQYVKSNTSMVFDVFAGVGLNHVSLGKISPTQIFSIESDPDLYKLLFHNSQLNGILNRALVAQLDPSLPYVDITELRSGHRGLYRNIFDMYRMTSQCPTMVKLNELFNDQSTLEITMMKMISSLVQSLWLLKYCQPFYYLAGSSFSYPLIRILSSLPNYRIFWHITTTIRMSTPHRKQDNQVVISLVAIPSSMHEPQDMFCDNDICDGLLIPVEENKYLIQNYDVKLQYKTHGMSNNIDDDANATDDHTLMTGYIAHSFTNEQTCDQSDQNITKDTIPILHQLSIADVQVFTVCHKTNMISFYVHLEAIMDPFHPLMDEYDGLQSETSSFVSSPKPTLMFQECLESSMELYIASIIEAQCILWLSTLHLRFYDSIRVNDSKHLRYADRYTESKIMDELTAQHHKKDDQQDNTVHIHALVKACTAFAVKQWQMMRDTAIYRASSSVPILPHMAVSNNSNNNHTTKSSIENDGTLLRNHTHHRPPFSLLSQPEACGEPLWCTHTIELQRRLTAWQNPNRGDSIARKRDRIMDTTPHRGESHRDPTDPTDPTFLSSKSFQPNRTCQNAKYLLFQPRSDQNGIGSMFGLIASAFRLSLCLGRIFVLLPTGEESTLTKWRHPGYRLPTYLPLPVGCQGNTFACYFQPLSDCLLTKDIMAHVYATDGGSDRLDTPPLSQIKYLHLTRFPIKQGICKMCGDDWTGDMSLFEGLGIVTSDSSSWYFESVEEYSEATQYIDRETKNIHHASSFLSKSPRLFWMSIFLRYLLRPRTWLRQQLLQIVHDSLVVETMTTTTSPSAGPNPTPAAVTIQSMKSIPFPCLSLHIRYGSKINELDHFEPLSRYMNLIIHKYPHVHHVFVSTETESIIHELVQSYPVYTFYYLVYPRIQYLDLFANTSIHLSIDKITNQTIRTDYPLEFLYSLANLYVASEEASGYVGSLSSSWCGLINALQRTRGDGGYDYLSVDRGSSYSICF